VQLPPNVGFHLKKMVAKTTANMIAKFIYKVSLENKMTLLINFFSSILFVSDSFSFRCFRLSVKNLIPGLKLCFLYN
jgi:hypothetical protein